MFCSRLLTLTPLEGQSAVSLFLSYDILAPFDAFFVLFVLLEEGEGMTKQDIINQVCESADLPRSKAEEAVETVIGLIKDALGDGEAVILRRFGTFQVRAKSKRVGRNPKTGEEAEISARKVVRFKSGKHFKQAVNDEDSN